MTPLLERLDHCLDDLRSVVEGLLDGTEREQHGRHPGFAEHREPHPLDLWVKVWQRRCSQQAATRGRRAPDHRPTRTVGRRSSAPSSAGPAWASNPMYTVAANRLAIAACAAASGSSDATTVALRCRSAWTSWRESALSPPNCPTTTADRSVTVPTR